MNEITLDSVIRRYLAKHNLPLHYYLPILILAKDGLEDLHFDVLGKVKHAKIAIGTNNQGTLPADFIKVVSVGIDAGDKVRPIGFDPALNPADNNDEAFDIEADVISYGASLSLSNTSLFLNNYYNQYGAYNGKLFGRPLTWTDGYTINKDEGFIRLNNKSEADELHMVYLSMPGKVSNKWVIDPMARRALDEFINWQRSRILKSPDQSINRAEFYNELRKLKARNNKMKATEIKRAFSRSNKLTIK